MSVRTKLIDLTAGQMRTLRAVIWLYQVDAFEVGCTNGEVAGVMGLGANYARNYLPARLTSLVNRGYVDRHKRGRAWAYLPGERCRLIKDQIDFAGIEAIRS